MSQASFNERSHLPRLEHMSTDELKALIADHEYDLTNLQVELVSRAVIAKLQTRARTTSPNTFFKAVQAK